MDLPSEEYYQKLLDEHAVPEPIQRHLRKVTEVGAFIAESLKRNGVVVDVALVVMGCKIHDAFKTASLKALEAKPEWGYTPSAKEIEAWKKLRERFQGIHETLVAAEMIRPDFPQFAEFVAKIGSTGNPTYLGECIELQILHYADWRVQFDTIISFDDRLAYLRDAYKDKWLDKGPNWWNDMLEKEKELERDLFVNLPFSPNDLEQAMTRSQSV